MANRWPKGYFGYERAAYICLPDARAVHLHVAECAFGGPLPKGTEVHHVDEDKHNNANTNLVICQDRKYHALLHVRTRVVRAGGNPNTHNFCCHCRVLYPNDRFSPNRRRVTGLSNQCKDCKRRSANRYYHRKRREREDAVLQAP